MYSSIHYFNLPYKPNQNGQNRQDHESAVGDIGQVNRETLQFVMSDQDEE